MCHIKSHGHPWLFTWFFKKDWLFHIFRLDVLDVYLYCDISLKKQLRRICCVEVENRLC